MKALSAPHDGYSCKNLLDDIKFEIDILPNLTFEDNHIKRLKSEEHFPFFVVGWNVTCLSFNLFEFEGENWHGISKTVLI